MNRASVACCLLSALLLEGCLRMIGSHGPGQDEARVADARIDVVVDGGIDRSSRELRIGEVAVIADRASDHGRNEDGGGAADGKLLDGSAPPDAKPSADAKPSLDTMPPPDTRPPDSRPPDARPPDSKPPDAKPVDLPLPDLGCILSTAWWSSGYGYRRKLTISETVSGTLAAGYSVKAGLDTSSLVSAGKLTAAGADLRVVRHASSGTVELDRHLVKPSTTASEIWFKTQVAIDGSDSTYYLYYGSPSAGAAPAHWSDSMGTNSKPSAVYLAADDFEDQALGVKPGGWEGSSKYTVETINSNKVLKVQGTNPNANYLFAGDYAWTDVVVQAQLSIQKTSGDHYGLYARADKATDFDTLFFGLQSNSQLALYTVTIASASANALTSASSKGTWSLSPAAGTSWHELRMTLLGNTAELFYDGVKKSSYTIGGSSMQKGRMGLCAGYPDSEASWDNVVVRRLVSPEPTVSLGAEEARCP